MRLVIGSIVLLIIIIGAAAGYYLTQTSQEIRQQAYLGQSCTKDTDCSGYPNEKCAGNQCVSLGLPPSCLSQELKPWEPCDPTPGDGNNECQGNHKSAAPGTCPLGYKKWICGKNRWIPDYGDPEANTGPECVGVCPWTTTTVNGAQVCCPKSPDACNPSTDNYKCTADPFVAQCKTWTGGGGACPSNQKGVWTAIDHCTGDGCECGPGGLFEGYSGPGCDCGGGGLTCNEQCSTNADCTAINPNWACVTANDGFRRCRLASNPSSTTCQSGGGGGDAKVCNDTCTSSSQCPSGTSCLPTYNFSSAFTDVTSNVANVGSGTITGFKSLVINGAVAQHFVRNNKVYYRPNYNTAFNDVTANFTGTGSGNITSVSSHKLSGVYAQYLVRGGKVYFRPNTSAGTAFTDVTNNVINIGSGTITSYSTQYLSTAQGALTVNLLTRGGKAWANYGSNPSQWVDTTASFSVGSGDITDASFLLDLDNSIKHYYVKGGKIYYRNAPVESSNRCRLPAYPNAANCQPPTPSLQCNSDCTTNAQCSNALGAGYSCVTNKCRLTANPTSTTCQPATALQCNSTCSTDAQCKAVNTAWFCEPTAKKCRLQENPSSTTCSVGIPLPPACMDLAILSQDNTIINPKSSPSPFFVGQIIKFRCAADNPGNSQIQKYQFKITEPGGTIVQDSAINPAGKTVTSLDYQIKKSGSFQAQCRICLTNGICQAYMDIK